MQNTHSLHRAWNRWRLGLATMGETSEHIRLLLVEDSEEDAELLLRELERNGFHTVHERVWDKTALEEALQKNWDIVISDFSLPGFDGLRAFQLVKEHRPALPFVFVSGVLGETRAVEAMRAGAKDYVVKGQLERIGPIIRRELAESESRKRRSEAEHALSFEQRRYREIFRAAPVALLEIDFSGLHAMLSTEPYRGAIGSVSDPSSADRFLDEALDRTLVVDANPAAVELAGASEPSQLIGPVSQVMRPGSRALWKNVVQALQGGSDSLRLEAEIENLLGRKLDVLVAFRAPAEASHRLVASLIDLTEKNSLERQLRAAQRMEAVGRLAGGIAHDFNNVLTVIESYSSFLAEALASQPELFEDVKTIREAVGRAEGLTRQLLALSHRQVAEPRVLDINQILTEIEKILRRLIGEDVELTIRLDPELDFVEMDPTHLEQIIMNLAVNARDAMPRGGSLEIETRAFGRRGLTDSPSLPDEIRNGQHIELSVRDNGEGMDPETRSRIFEPFFTTKAPGRGTGLGLSTTYGIVKQTKGHIVVESEPGRGTTFKIFLPRTNAKPSSTRRLFSRVRPSLQGTETVLLVEDEKHVRSAATRILRRAGFVVLAAEDGHTALDLAQTHPGTIDLLITDIVMPLMSGKEIADRVGQTRRAMRVLYMSGYASDVGVQHGISTRQRAYLQKPFSSEALLHKVREVLDAN